MSRRNAVSVLTLAVTLLLATVPLASAGAPGSYGDLLLETQSLTPTTEWIVVSVDPFGTGAFAPLVVATVPAPALRAARAPQPDPCDPYSSGWWTRQCRALGLIERGKGDPNGPQPSMPEAELQALFAAADAILVPFMGQTACEALDPDPASDVCERALDQCAGMLMNLFSGRVAETCPLRIPESRLPAGYPPPTTVGEALGVLLVLQPPPTPEDCRLALTVCSAINR